MVSGFCSPGCTAAVLLKKELRSQRRFDSSMAGGGSSTRLFSFGDTDGGVDGPLVGCAADLSSSSSESSLLSEPESEPESELELALPELGGA